MRPFRIVLAAELPERDEETAWLVEGLWAANEVGVVGGEPKSYKTFLALELAVSVASGSPCLGRYPVPDPGPVLLYVAEDSAADVRFRLEGICRASNIDFQSLGVHILVEPTVRLDVDEDRERLDEAVARVGPSLLILDPFVRLHRVDENVSAQVVPLLAFLRDLQRRHRCAVCVVHHARKGGGRARAGQTLRGSSEFHSWGGSNLYVRRTGADEIRFDIEQRAAPSREGICVRLVDAGGYLSLRVIDEPSTEPDHSAARPAPEERIVRALADHGGIVHFAELRELVGMRTQTFGKTLAALVEKGAVAKDDGGYSLIQ